LAFVFGGIVIEDESGGCSDGVEGSGGREEAQPPREGQRARGTDDGMVYHGAKC
jgi:hypothetical protein